MPETHGSFLLPYLVHRVFTKLVSRRYNWYSLFMSSSWWIRPALIWERANSFRGNVYWHLVDVCHSSCFEEICSLSYEQYMKLVIYIAIQLRAMILRHQSILNVKSSGLYSVPIVVATPEGPLLPIVVAAVHVLNVPFFSSEHAAWMSAILIPLDPSDGFDRIVSILHEVRPALVLTASCTDCDLFQRIVGEIPFFVGDGFINPIIRFSVANVVNLSSLLDTDGDVLSTSERLALQWSLNQLGEGESLLQLWHGFLIFLNTAESQSQDFLAIENRISHIVYTSGSTGQPKGCVSSVASLLSYITAKNKYHEVTSNSVVLLASALSFDPCISDILATIAVRGTLGLARRVDLIHNCGTVLRSLSVSHVLCTPTLWSAVPLFSDVLKSDYPCLQVIALGGEPIPRPLLRAWRPLLESNHSIQMFATYGATEACVYQTIGKVSFSDSPSTRQDVGLPFRGLTVRICAESVQEKLLDVPECGFPQGVGEVILAGCQIDELSSYLFRPSLTEAKFVRENAVTYYRTGDRGFVDEDTSRLHILGRIEGEEGSVKINGIRIELGEIEASLVDEVVEFQVVLAAIAVVSTTTSDTGSAAELHAYIVLSKACLDELKISVDVPDNGLLCCDGPILALLRERCRRKAKAVPSKFIIVPRIPMSSTGKRDRRKVPSIELCLPAGRFFCAGNILSSVRLQDYGRSGAIVAEEIRSCLNLQLCQMSTLSTATTFAMIGGDSLSATRVVRAIYARHHGLVDNRFIGGDYGKIDGPLSPTNLLRSENLGVYVNFLDGNGICCSCESIDDNCTLPITENVCSTKTNENYLFDSLLQSTTAGQRNIAISLLDVGANPNFGESKGRLGKISGRKVRKELFRSNPLHLACLHGDDVLVKKLLEKNAKYNIPNAASLFPLHLSASGDYGKNDKCNEDECRLRCVKYLLDRGCPLHMRDGNNQTIIHAAARSGHVKLLEYCLSIWKCHCGKGMRSQLSFDSRDNWSRTPVHWAILNMQTDALTILIQNGCSASPEAKKIKQKSSVAIETPLQMCNRLYSSNPDISNLIKTILEKL
jgi:non-ribosomal peptide synthetase component F/ankyrin repeat protein